MKGLVQRLGALVGAVLIAGCATHRPPVELGPSLSPQEARAMIGASIPQAVTDRAGWIDDIYTGFTAQDFAPSRENVCAVIAVIEQESNFQVNPLVPGLGKIAWQEIDTRAERAGVPLMVVHGAMELRSPDGRRYSERIDAAKTEKDLSDIYEDFIGSVPLGRTLFAGFNPIRTRGPMQVNVVYAQQYNAIKPYPYPVQNGIAEALFTRRGSLYFGIAHLFAYQPPYDQYLFRFADFNAGQFASRNAAFQNAVSVASGARLATDGALLPTARGATDGGETERALRSIAVRLGVSESEIHAALEEGKSATLEQTKVYGKVYALAERLAKHPLPRALVPTIKLQGPKISRTLTTNWYAHRVDGRFARCLR